jgi:hypothetical protein
MFGRSEQLGQRCSNCFQKSVLPASGAHRSIELILSESPIVVNMGDDIRRHQLSKFLGGRSMVFGVSRFFLRSKRLFCAVYDECLESIRVLWIPARFPCLNVRNPRRFDHWLSAQSNIRYTRISAGEQ